MKKLSKFLPLLALSSLLLVGCSEPTLHKPRFARYGDLVSVDAFRDLLETKQKTYRNNFLDEDYNYYLHPAFDYSIAYKSGYGAKGNLYVGEASVFYQDVSITTKVDASKKRLLQTGVQKIYREYGNQSEGSQYLSNQYQTEEGKIYAEVKDESIFIANVIKKEFQQNNVSETTRKYFATYYLKASIMNYIYYTCGYYSSDLPSGDSYRYYVNQNVFTVVRQIELRDVNSYSKTKTITQMKISNNERSYKGSSISKESSEGKTETVESYLDFSIKRTNVDVSAVDYSNFKNAS